MLFNLGIRIFLNGLLQARDRPLRGFLRQPEDSFFAYFAIVLIA
jgi:hypothetical protein